LELDIPGDLYEKANWSKEDSLGTKGHKAVVTVQNMLKRGKFAFPRLDGVGGDSQVVTEKQIDIRGTDIIVFARIKMQIKCDYRGGPQELGGTGNLYLQVAESNPFRRYS